jgi:hypothetical protein
MAASEADVDADDYARIKRMAVYTPDQGYSLTKFDGTTIIV